MANVAKASLDVVGEIGEHLPDPMIVFGSPADSCYRIGDSRRGERPSPRDAWFLVETESLAVGGDFADAAQGCLERLLLRLKSLDVGSRLRQHNLLAKASITVHGFCPGLRDANLRYSVRTLTLAADLGVPIEEDFYQSSETGDL